MFLSSIFMLSLTISANIFTSFINANELKTYIVHLTPPEGQEFTQPHELERWYDSFLSKAAYNSKDDKPMMVYAYHHVIIGFAAQMSKEQAKHMEIMSGVLSVMPDSVYQLHTTHSPQFLGLDQKSSFWKDSNYGKGTIIGVLDTGITPDHPSFDDKGVSPAPERWKGKCEEAGCNNKVIGMKNFIKGSSPIDENGHGTHTSGTAAGNFVDNVDIHGNANGTASGTAPFAHLAHYKVCDQRSCDLAGLYAGMDAAIGDGVDVLSLSLGQGSLKFYQDPLAIGTFSAIQKGIFVSCSAGNDGPAKSKLSNEYPWALTVGASTMDRKIRATVLLGNNKSIHGESLYQPKNFHQKLMPLVYPGGIKGDEKARTCSSLNDQDVKGKVVLCDMGGGTVPVTKGKVVKGTGGSAMILVNSVTRSGTTEPEFHVLPTSQVSHKEGDEIKRYINKTKSPEARIILSGTVLNIKSAPEVGYFSSRGPNIASPGILKPDIIGPGVNILAAWPHSVESKQTETKAKYNMISGTSMACPHLSGIAALLKSTHPDWSPAAIKSAIMTTASQVNQDGKPIVDEKDLPADIFAIGAGHVNPTKANDPGLIFDIQPDDYIPYLCGLNYTNDQIKIIVKKNFSCDKSIPEEELNYPSVVVTLKKGDRKTISRTVTNVGVPNSSYEVKDVSLPPGVRLNISITSPGLVFTAMNQSITYKLHFSRSTDADNLKDPYGKGFITWVSGKYSVRTPFAFKFD
uniref:subtilisin-like protease n=1 Tax=Erigeron canadensis TaxID=72917 RepID=UPI001CB96D92|nr:subtilisin-like protease [Erigeron canadensis]